MCKKSTLEKFNLAVKIYLVVVVCYLKQVFHLLCDKRLITAEALLYFPSYNRQLYNMI